MTVLILSFDPWLAGANRAAPAGIVAVPARQSEYRQHYDVSAKVGQSAGSDPVSGCIWFGDSIQDVIAQRDADGSAAPLFFIRMGSENYYRKAGYR